MLSEVFLTQKLVTEISRVHLRFAWFSVFLRHFRDRPGLFGDIMVEMEMNR